MSSTTHKNSIGNYELEQNNIMKRNDYNLYKGRMVDTVICLPGDGLSGARYHSSLLSENSIDIESNLFGIGSTNLVKKQIPVVPRIKNLNSLSMYEKQFTHLPLPITIIPNQRPFNT